MHNCNICSTESSKQREGTPYWICPSCELWFQDPLPPKVYEGSHEEPGHLMSDHDKHVNSSIADWLFKDYLKSGDFSLDIGSKYPYLSHCLAKHGVNAYAMDNISIVPEYSKELGIPILQEDFEFWRFSADQIGKYKLITMIHCFEHMYDPVAAIKKLRALVHNDGKVLIRSPANDVSGIERDLIPSHYIIHPYVHSLTSILEILRKTENLFVIEKVSSFDRFGQRDIILRPISKKPTIYVGMMVKNEERDLPVLLESIKDVANGLVVLDTGSTDKTEDILTEYSHTIEYFYTKKYLEASAQDETGDWKLEDFSKARNEYLRILNIDSNVDWIMSFDADDTLLEPIKVNRLRYLYAYDTYTFDIYPSVFPQHRMWKKSLGIRYQFPVHEYPQLAGENLDTHIGILHNYAPGTGEGSNKRNLRILLKEYETNPTPRTTFYLAQTYHHGDNFLPAIDFYEKRINQGVFFRDEWLSSFLYKGRCERAAGLIDNAIKTLLKGIAEEPDWAEFWVELAYIYFDQSKWGKCISVCYAAINCIDKPNGLWKEPNKYTDQPRRLVSFCMENLGRKEKALKWAIKAKDCIIGLDVQWDKRIEGLSKNKIALYRPGAIGDVLMTLNLVPLLKAKYPGYEVDYYTEVNGLDEIFKQAGVDNVFRGAPVGNYARQFNLVGYPLKEGYPYQKMRQHLVHYFSEEMGLNISLQSIPRLYLEKPNSPVPGKYATIHPKAAWSPYKNWSINRWEEVVNAFPEIQFYQIGTKDDPKIEGCLHDFMGAELKTSIALFANSSMHLGIDSFTNHLSNYVWKPNKYSASGRTGKVPSIILWGSTQWDAAGYPENINISMNLSCQPCFREDPKISTARIDICPNRPTGIHECMNQIKPEMVIDEIRKMWSKIHT